MRQTIESIYRAKGVYWVRGAVKIVLMDTGQVHQSEMMINSFGIVWQTSDLVMCDVCVCVCVR